MLGLWFSPLGQYVLDAPRGYSNLGITHAQYFITKKDLIHPPILPALQCYILVEAPLHVLQTAHPDSKGGETRACIAGGRFGNR
jgi:hypothetical protein